MRSMVNIIKSEWMQLCWSYIKYLCKSQTFTIS